MSPAGAERLDPRTAAELLGHSNIQTGPTHYKVTQLAQKCKVVHRLGDRLENRAKETL